MLVWLTVKKAILLTFSTKHLAKKDKVRFFYALKGRGEQEGIVQRTKTEHIGSSVLLISPEHEKEFDDFFKVWEVEYTKRKITIEDDGRA